MANINRIEFSKTTLYVHLSDGTLQTCLLTQLPAVFLYAATAQQRANYTLADRDRAVTWPDLGETLLLDSKGRLARYVAPVAEPEVEFA